MISYTFTMIFRVDCSSIHWKIVDGQALVLNLDSGFYYTLNAMGTVVWNLCIGGFSFDQILNFLQVHYEENYEMIFQSLRLFCEEVVKEGLLGVVDNSFSSRDVTLSDSTGFPLHYQSPQMTKYERLYELGIGT
jgi:hypothetical protein